MKTYDILYTFQYDGVGQATAIKRLRSSIKSIISQDVNVCVCNTGKGCIKSKLSNLGDIRYVHKENKGSFSKALNINFGVKNLVKTRYFFLSDIDLIYPPDYVAQFEAKYLGTMNVIPIRVVTGVYNIGKQLISDNWNDYVTELESCFRDHSKRDQERNFFGVSVGNGLVHRDTFYIVRGLDEDLSNGSASLAYSGEDALLNDRMGYMCKYMEDPDFNLRSIHIYHKLTMNTDNEAQRLAQRIWRGRRLYLQNKFKQQNFNPAQHILDVQGNQGKTWGIIP